jgi:hypothetical protein
MYFKKAETIFEGLYGPDSIHAAVIYNNLGGVYES